MQEVEELKSLVVQAVQLLHIQAGDNRSMKVGLLTLLTKHGISSRIATEALGLPPMSEMQLVQGVQVNKLSVLRDLG